MSNRRAAGERKYGAVRRRFLEKNPLCAVSGDPATDVHHMKGKEGYADRWAKENDVPLLVDDRWFLPVKRYWHGYIEEHPEWALSLGYSLSRADVIP